MFFIVVQTSKDVKLSGSQAKNKPSHKQDVALVATVVFLIY